MTAYARSGQLRTLAAWLVVSGIGLACTAGDGRGVVKGSLDVPLCFFDSDNKPRGLPSADQYSLNPDFFVGEPFDSNTPFFPANQMAIRVQNSGQRLEFADALVFWVADSYEVGRCLRGRLNADGSGDWNPALCDRDAAGPPGPSNPGRLFVGQETETVSAHFVLNFTCSAAYISADALGACTGQTCPLPMLCPGRNSWIRFSRFGSISGDLTKALGTDYKVNNGEKIEASEFHVELCDANTVAAFRDQVLPVPPPVITGTLDGSFSFDLRPQLQ